MITLCSYKIWLTFLFVIPQFCVNLPNIPLIPIPVYKYQKIDYDGLESSPRITTGSQTTSSEAKSCETSINVSQHIKFIHFHQLRICHEFLPMGVDITNFLEI